ncbi:uncharacterized protein [Physcomitrium patens]|uniref:uncharacterized protein isoform X5 n=1 Tax=Physcomitrium patens TaxID=3218 RepID=UPI000D177851|nr:WD repeat-containing protein 35-like isoform X4 [Physcomitrium patens]XP_024366604.1 WD repeat-containing protein 35-like isoform X4 [Physcomitrium patens]|eukprot:XP_024366603.1 WD repeat-containing protein 35-like isoform X4 [Physcomitrella patens]
MCTEFNWLMRHEMDEEPILLELQMTITCIKWSPDGDVLGVVGSDVSTNVKAPSSIVQLFSHTGVHLRTLRVPGARTSALSWEGGGLRLALAVDSYIYLANIRLEYKWAFFGSSTCVYGFKKKDHSDHSVMFWDIVTGERYCKCVNHLIAVCAASEFCVLATLGEEPDQYVLILCNAIGNPVDSKYVKTQPLHVAMNLNFVFVASEFHVYMWKYSPKSSSFNTGESEKMQDTNGVASQESTFHIDEEFFQKSGKGMRADDSAIASTDKICCMCCSDKFLMVGREFGVLHCYDIVGLRQEGKETLHCRPHAIELNCDSTRLSVIDVSGMLYLYEVQRQPHGVKEKQGTAVRLTNKVPNFERKDVWNIKWADDNPNLLAVMEKARMYILRGTEPEEPVACTAYLCSFHDLQIQAIHLDDVMHQPEDPSMEHVFNYETKTLRDTQQMLSAVDIQDAYSYVEEHSHPRLWISLANHALETLDLSYAEKAFVRCQNYHGVRFVKSLHALKNKSTQKAEICVYFKRDKEAEQIYYSMDRKDLVVDMRMKLGDWIMLEKLLEGGGGNDSLLELTWNNIGDYHADRQSWDKAAVYYYKSKNCEKLAECLYALGDWDALGALLESLHQGSTLFLSLAKKFANVGICKHAVTAFVEGKNIKAAIDASMDLNHWDVAMNLAMKHDELQYVESAIAKYTMFLIDSGNPLQAVQVHIDGGQQLEAAKILVRLACQMATIKASPLMVKKLYVLAAFQADASRASFDTKQHDASSSLNSFFEDAWHGAEAYHFWLLAHRELYASHYDQAMKVSLWLRNYEDILDVIDIYSLIALTSFLNKHYAHCSKAVSKLESLSHISEKQKNMYSQLALSIFTRFNPINPHRTITQCCKNCNTPIQELQTKCSSPTCKITFPICMTTGNVIVDESNLQCSTCKHYRIVSKLKQCKYCPLCHSPSEHANILSI